MSTPSTTTSTSSTTTTGIPGAPSVPGTPGVVGTPGTVGDLDLSGVSVDCDHCTMQGSTDCEGCVVSYLLDRSPDDAVIIDAEEARALRLLHRAGLVPSLLFERRVG